MGTLALVQRLPESVSRICFASSLMVYGPEAPQPVAETHCARPATVYAVGKLATESYLRLHAMTSGRSVVILRYATAYGPMETVPRAVPNFIRHVLSGRPPVIYGEGDDVRDYVHVHDVVDATLLALAHVEPAVQVFNVGTGRGHTTREVAEKIIRLAGEPTQPIYQPKQNAASRIVGDISRARNILGYEPQIGLDNGLCDEIQYFGANPQLWRS
jgi:UDP-glucose 4-epimerase